MTDVLEDWMAFPVAIEPRLHKQAIPAHRPGEGRIGDCFRTCIACLIDAPSVGYVPHFVELTFNVDPKPGWAQLAIARLWLRELDLDLMTVELATAVAIGNPYLLPVNSKTGDWAHCVVAQGDKVIHDPSGVGGYTLDDARHGEADILVTPYSPDPFAAIRLWRQEEGLDPSPASSQKVTHES